MSEPQKPRPETAAGPGRRLGYFLQGAGNFLIPLCLAGLCLAVSCLVCLLIYPYVRYEPWFRDAAAVVTAATILSVFARFWAAVKAGLGYAAARFRRGWRHVRFAFVAASPDPMGSPSSNPRSASESSRVLPATLALVASLFCLLVISLAVAVRLVEAARATVPVEGFRLGGSPTFRSTIFFPKEAKFADWTQACSLDTPSFEAYKSGVLEFLRPFGRCASGVNERLQLRLHGFASSSGLEWPPDTSNLDECAVWKSCLARERCEPLNRSDGVERECLENAFNVCVAEERARQAQRWMLTLSPIPDSFDIEVVQWRSYRKMAAEQIVDRENDVYDGTAGVINRRVELTVVESGSCQVMARESDEQGLPGQGLARSALAWTDNAYSRFKCLESNLTEVLSRLGRNRPARRTVWSQNGVGR